MTSTIYDKENNRISKSRNLRGLFSKAIQFRGVKAIELRDNGTGGAFVAIKYANGYTGQTVFASMVYAIKWARDRSKRKNTWWSDCEVVTPEKTASMDAIAKLCDFTKHYLIAALWSDLEEGNPHMELADIDIMAIDKAARECANFQLEANTLLQRVYPKYAPHQDAPTPQCAAGHDFHFTRNGHGVGFWDRGFGDDGDKISDMVGHGTKYPPVSWYVGDDGRVHST